MQRMITLDSVIYVHENPKRRRRPLVEYVPYDDVDLEPAVTPAEGAYAEPSEGWSPEPMPLDVAEEPEAEVAEATVAAAEAVQEDWSEAVESEPEFELESESANLALELEPEPHPEPLVAAPGNTQTIVRANFAAPPPGYAIEFGTGRLVKVHSYKGRMSYPSSGW